MFTYTTNQGGNCRRLRLSSRLLSSSSFSAVLLWILQSLWQLHRLHIRPRKIPRRSRSTPRTPRTGMSRRPCSCSRRWLKTKIIQIIARVVSLLLGLIYITKGIKCVQKRKKNKILRYGNFCKKFPIQTYGRKFCQYNFLGKIKNH